MIEDYSGVMEVTEEPCSAITSLLMGAGSDTDTIGISGVLPSNPSILIRPASLNKGASVRDGECFLFVLVCLAGTPSCH